MTSRQPAKSKVPNPAACTPQWEALTDKDGQQDRIPPGLCASQAVFLSSWTVARTEEAPVTAIGAKVAEYGDHQSPAPDDNEKRRKKDAQTVYFRICY